MIARLIEWCVYNRVMVLLLALGLVAVGAWSARNVTVDAIPDLSDVQVVVRAEFPGQAPQVVQDQVTYPLTTAMLAVPQAKVVRGSSMFGDAFVYIIFEDGTDLYWARSRVLEQLSTVASQLPDGATVQLGPDATGVGWVYQYVLTTGPYCPEHPQGLWHDETTGEWSADPIPGGVLHRVFPDRDTCPLDGTPLAQPEVDLAELRSLQDWYLKYELTGVEGVSEIAGVGGFVKQYQITVDPVKLLAFNLPHSRIVQAIRDSNVDVGGRVLELSETEYMVRGRGYLGSTAEEGSRTQAVMADLRRVALGSGPDGNPIYLEDVADVRIGPDIRRGVAEWNGEGETVGGIVVMRFGDNARDVIDRVKARLAELEEGLPPGVAIEVAYDRSDLIERAVSTLSHTLVEEILVVSLVVLLFLMHARSAFVAVLVLPTGVLASLATMYLLGLNANIMSLGGIAISIGVMIDSAIVMVENAHKHLEEEKRHSRRRSHAAVIAEAATEVGPTLFFSLLIITVSFLPIFVLGEQSGRMFKPLAYTKTFAIFAGALLAVTMIPALMVWFLRERSVPERWPAWLRWSIYVIGIAAPAMVLALVPLNTLGEWRWWLVGGWLVISAALLLPQRMVSEERSPISTALQRMYDPAFRFVMQYKVLTLLLAVAAMAATIYPLRQLGNEFMPPLEEGDLLYMPTTDPGLSVAKARELLQQTDKLIVQFPEVESVFGKAGRADTATDPAPPSMFETTITLHRDKSRWRTTRDNRFYSDWPHWAAWLPRRIWPDVRPITLDELVYGYMTADGQGGTINVPGLNDAVRIPGLTNSWTMPIRTRIDMLSTGIRTPVGVKVMGPDLPTLSEKAGQIADALQSDPRTSGHTTSAFAEKAVGGRYIDIDLNREAIARHGLSVREVQDVVMSAVGGVNVTQTVEGLERYPVNVRYPSELRDSLPALRQTLVATPDGAQIPLGQLANIHIEPGPPMVKSENARLTAWVYVDVAGTDIGSYVDAAKEVVADHVTLPEGYSIAWSGQYQYMQEARAKLMIAVPLAAGAIILLLYLATRSWLRVGIVLLAVPFSLIGAIWLVWMLDYNLSLAVWVGIIALAGLDAETGLVMLLYLDNSYERWRRDGRMRNANDLWHAVHEGAVQRIRPKTMTVVTTFVGLVPLLWATGAGADTMRRLAAPMVGGLVTSFALELLIYPVLYYLARRVKVPAASGDQA